VAELVKLVQTMTHQMVEFPSMRRDVMSSLAGLSDVEYQQRVWIRREYPQPGYYDDLRANIALLYDDREVLPSPADSIGSILLPGDEIPRLAALAVVLDDLIDSHESIVDSVFMADPRWNDVLRLSALALAAMVLTGGYEDIR
jgi:hypothetical protein